MTQIIAINDTGITIAAAGLIMLDGVNNVAPIKKIRSASLINMFDTGVSIISATPTALVETAVTTPSGLFVNLASENAVRIGVTMKPFQVLVLDVVLKGEFVRT